MATVNYTINNFLHTPFYFKFRLFSFTPNEQSNIITFRSVLLYHNNRHSIPYTLSHPFSLEVYLAQAALKLCNWLFKLPFVVKPNCIRKMVFYLILYLSWRMKTVRFKLTSKCHDRNFKKLKNVFESWKSFDINRPNQQEKDLNIKYWRLA